jgi:hypothetical protein
VAVRRELDVAGRGASALGQAALLLAERIDAGTDTGSVVAALSRELRATLEAATRAASPRRPDRVDELRQRRQRRAQ